MKTLNPRTKTIIAGVIASAFVIPHFHAHAEDNLRVDLKLVASGFVAPVSATAAPGESDNLYVVDQTGQIYRFNLREHTRSLFLDVSKLLVPLGIPALGGYDERGLLGLAFHPDFATNHLFYTFTTEPPEGAADFQSAVSPDHNNVIREWNASSLGQMSSRVVLKIQNPQFNHTGGTIAFGLDKMLYIALGDGGGEDDQDCQIGVDGKVTQGHGPNGTGQDPGSILASLLRINPDPNAASGMLAANRQYRIPVDNPGTIAFATGVLNVFPEVWAKGLRNPFRFSFDALSGKLIAGDVGQNDIEEIDVVQKGGNYGWRIKEGTFMFDPAGCAIKGFATDGRAVRDTPRVPAFAIDPIAQYHHNQGRAVIAGFVYHGSTIPRLQGQYVFGDYSKSTKPEGSLLRLGSVNSHQLQKIERLADDKLKIFVLGFGQDAAGELYVLGNETGIPAGKTGVVKKIVPGSKD